MEIILNFLKINGAAIFSTIIKFISSLITAVTTKTVNAGTIIVRPFFFSRRRKAIIPPYVYSFVLFVALIASIVVMLILLWEDAWKGIKDSTVIFSSLSALIVTEMGSMAIIMSAYNKGKDDGSDFTEDKPVENKPNGVQ